MSKNKIIIALISGMIIINSSFFTNRAYAEETNNNTKKITYEKQDYINENDSKSNEIKEVDNINKSSNEVRDKELKKNKWELKDEVWYYYDSNGQLVKGFKTIDGYKYYFDNNNKMVVGWQKINGSWYYFRSNGTMRIGWEKFPEGWYYLKEDGTMAIGWEEINNTWYHLRDNGVMDTGWQKINGDWYYLGQNGAMQTGWQNVDGTWYYLRSNGTMRTGWEKFPEGWYYLKDNGAMATGWEKINDNWYYLGQNGIMATGWKNLDGITYYLRENGSMATAWESIDGQWYHFTTGGALETNKVVGEWYVNKDGVGNEIVTEGVYGKSGKGRDLEYYRIGNGKKVLFSVFGVHGYEDAWNGDSQELKIIAEKSVNRLRSEYNTKGIDLSEWSVYIIPSANPDGRIDGWTNNGPGRTTVTTKNDINRSFPTGFSPFYSARNYTGPTALGSPEAKALYSFINKTMEGATEKVLLDVHGWENKTIGNPSIARYFDNEFGFRNINKYPGGFVITYGNAIGAKSVLVEFPVPYSHQDILRRDFSGKFSNGLVNILLNN
ncbi:M14 family zinc carboxypeptidase [Clostridium perfringens]|uniref:M14 family zinc carboxypeptidase n=1 Tax=Clostridium perfringens TaxID=1502 RepID=UPI001A296493|nr:M14 family zinc carboxypeptidase [Clostridium perfringens]HAT4220962.1 cell wall-binding protein [Clostridium perfringens]HAT4354901.1 cell wall-binding protein [Clostridium perfringens]